MEQNAHLTDTNLDELESHLWDAIDRLMAQGAAADTAFHQATAELGSSVQLGPQYERDQTDAHVQSLTVPRRLAWAVAMFRNYMSVAIRQVQRHKTYSMVNMAGLILGMTAALLCLNYIQFERSYDAHWDDADQIYRIVQDRFTEDEVRSSAMTPPPVAAALRNAFPAYSVTGLFRDTWHNVAVSLDDDRHFSERDFVWTDSLALEVFRFPLQSGDPATALTQSNSVLLTASTARRYFGDANPIGRTLVADGKHELVITGVLADIPHNSHLRFDFLAFSPEQIAYRSRWWITDQTWTYVRLETGTSSEALAFAEQLPSFIATHYPEDLRATTDLLVQPVTDIHLHSDRLGEAAINGSVVFLYVFAAIALMLLVIASINYVNLATAQAISRAREIGVRKVVGATRLQLAKQLLAESIGMGILAAWLALACAVLLIPPLNALLDLHLPHVSLVEGFYFWSATGLGLGMGFLAGLYPALALSSFEPAAILKGQKVQTGGRTLRSSLVVFQFAASIVLLVGAGVIHQQLNYLSTKDLGLDAEQVLMVHMPWMMKAQYDHQVFRDLLAQETVVKSVVPVDHAPWRGRNFYQFWDATQQKEIGMTAVWTEDHEGQFQSVFDVELKQGRGLSLGPERENARLRFEFVVNESALQLLGGTDVVGRELSLQDSPGTIVGVVEDFHFESLHHSIKPLVIISSDRAGYAYFAIRLQGGATQAALQRIEELWSTFAPSWPFSYFFADADYERLYQAEQQFSAIVTALTFVSILVACIGLFGLTLFVTAQRRKEVAIRKTFGATAGGVLVLLVQDFLKLVLVAFLLAIPVAYIGLDQWLQNFAYHVSPSAWVFLLTAIGVIGLTLCTVGYQAIRTASTNPIEALRHD